MAAPTAKPILFHYPPSIYSHRVLWYLWLRGIEYDECIQPPVMPRPDLASIDVGYRKIPILSIGKDVYCDSRLIISKLEKRYAKSSLATSTPAETGIQKLFENYSVDGGVFANTVRLMPYWTEVGLLSNKAFLDDRQKLSGRRMTKELMEAGRPDGMQNIRQVFDLFETTFLADGRDWVLGTKEPTVADIDAVWPFEWMIVDQYMKECLPKQNINETIYPKVYAWVRRFMTVVEEKKKACAKPTTLDGAAMKTRTLAAAANTDDIGFITDDPLDFTAGEQVQIFPSDYGQIGVSTGTLTGLTTTEVVITNSQDPQLPFPHALPPSPQIPKMTLIYHPMSPYSRKAYLLAHELALTPYLTLQKVVICPVPFPGWSDNNATVSAHNPLTKIPCLVSSDVPDALYDSSVICSYFENLAGVKRSMDARYWQLRTLHACADGIMDAAVLITYELRIRKAKDLFYDEWFEGQKGKIVRGLDRLEGAARSGVLPDPGEGPASADEVAVAVAVGMAGKMGDVGIEWRVGREGLVEWMGKWEGRKSFVETAPTRDWGSGDGKSVAKI